MIKSGVGVAVAADFVTRSHHTFDDGRIPSRHIARHKEGGQGVFLFEYFEEFWHSLFDASKTGPKWRAILLDIKCEDWLHMTRGYKIIRRLSLFPYTVTRVMFYFFGVYLLLIDNTLHRGPARVPTAKD